MTIVDDRVRERIERQGPVPFDEVVAAALYDPDGGFYATGGRAGRGGDFLTAPEVGPLFGQVVARALDTWWRDAGRPPVFTVVEAGAGPGTLARTVLAAEPECAPALHYLAVERSETQRALHARHLPLSAPGAVLDDLVRPTPSRRRPGPVVVSLPDLPRLPGPAVVLANELLDNLPFGLLERVPDGWVEIHVGVDDGHLEEVGSPVRDLPATLVRAAPGLRSAPPGARIPLQRAAARWLADARSLATSRGRVVALDYASPTADLAARPWLEWVRTYRAHVTGGHPLIDLGTQDITCEVAVDQLAPPPSDDRSQADWLRVHGIEELVAEGRRLWKEQAHRGDLAAVRARSRIHEAEALCDPDGLGGFRVLEWSGA